MKYTLLVTDYYDSIQSDSLEMLIDAALPFWDAGRDQVTIIENATDKIVWLNAGYV